MIGNNSYNQFFATFIYLLTLFFFVIYSPALAHQETTHNHFDLSGITDSGKAASNSSKEIKTPSGLGVDEKAGGFVPLDTVFFDETGRRMALNELINKPTLLLPVFYYCPQSCSLLLANLAIALNNVPFTPGDDFRVIALSFDEDEKPKIAQNAKSNYMKLISRPFPENEWKFLTGSLKNIRKVTNSMGFKFKKTDKHTFVHPNVLICLSGDGKIIRYIYGPSFLAGDIGMALLEAQRGTPGISVKRILSFCYNYDPKGNRYVSNILKVTAFIMLAALAAFPQNSPPVILNL
jgi:protein SCO1/2